MPRPADRRRSLQDLDGERWGAAPPGSTRLVGEVHRLRRVALDDLTAEDLRLLIGQDVASFRLVPLALERLRTDPLAGGELYPGALLSAVLRLDDGFWGRHQDLADELGRVLDDLAEPPQELHAEIARFRERST
jgi:hypothetical protein